jgi:type I restriction enzyme S subunit
MNTPKLRFKGFNDELIIVVLNNISDVLSGKRLPKGHNFISKKASGVPYITVSDMGKKFVSSDNIKYISEETESMISKYKVKTNDIIISVAGTLGKINIIDSTLENANLTENCDKITNFNGVDTNFLYHYLTSPSIEKQISAVNTVSSQPKLALERIRKFKISLPSITEQKKLGVFFDFMDKKIQLQQEKIDLLKEQKKGYMQKIFNQELRFKDENRQLYAAWKNVKLHTLVDQVKGNSLKNIDNITLPVLTISAKSGFVNQQDRFSEVIAGNSLFKYTELNKNDLSYNKGNSKTAKYGCVFVQSRHDKALVPNVYKSFRAKENVNAFYLQYLFATKLLDRQLKGIISSTARMDGLLNVSDEDFYNLNILCPSIDEQNKIVNLLLIFDQKIESEEKKLEGLLNQKQALMQQMFI